MTLAKTIVLFAGCAQRESSKESENQKLPKVSRGDWLKTRVKPYHIEKSNKKRIRARGYGWPMAWDNQKGYK